MTFPPIPYATSKEANSRGVGRSSPIREATPAFMPVDGERYADRRSMCGEQVLLGEERTNIVDPSGFEKSWPPDLPMSEKGLHLWT